MHPQDTTLPDIATLDAKPARKWDDPDYRKAYFAAYNAARREKTAEYHKAYREAHLEEKRARDRDYCAAHREEARQRASQWYRDHPEQAKASRKAWRQANLDKMHHYDKQYRVEHLEELRAYDRQRSPMRRDYNRDWARSHSEVNRMKARTWAKAHPEKARLHGCETAGRRRARLRQAHVEPVDRNAIIIRDRGICGICGKKVPAKQIVLDHILPLSQGGAHAPYNLQVAHARCNSIKADGRLPSQLRLTI